MIDQVSDPNAERIRAAAMEEAARGAEKNAVKQGVLREKFPPDGKSWTAFDAAEACATDIAALGQAITEAQAEGDTTLTAALRKMVTTVTVHRNYELEITGNLAPLTRGEEMVAGEGLDCFPPATLVIPFIVKAAA